MTFSRKGREAWGASSIVWLGMRVMGSPLSGRVALPAAKPRVTGQGRGPSRESDTRRPFRRPARRCCHVRPGCIVLADGGGVMDSGLDDERVVQAWKAHRPYLVDLAFRMLGDIGAAEDVVQDAFSRLIRTMPGEIEDERGWLIVVTSRLCLDQIRSARSRRERPHDSSEIEFVPTHTEPVGAGARRPTPPTGSRSMTTSGSPCWSCCSGSARPNGSCSCSTTSSACRSTPSRRPWPADCDMPSAGPAGPAEDRGRPGRRPVRRRRRRAPACHREVHRGVRERRSRWAARGARPRRLG